MEIPLILEFIFSKIKHVQSNRINAISQNTVTINFWMQTYCFCAFYEFYRHWADFWWKIERYWKFSWGQITRGIHILPILSYMAIFSIKYRVEALKFQEKDFWTKYSTVTSCIRLNALTITFDIDFYVMIKSWGDPPLLSTGIFSA